MVMDIFNLELADKYVYENTGILSEDWIRGFNENESLSGDINNVIRLLKRDCFVCLANDNNYELIYITNNPKLDGLLLTIEYDDPNHNAIAFVFADHIVRYYPQNHLNFVDIANIFQEHKTSMYSKIGDYIVVDLNKAATEYSNSTMLLLHKSINITIFRKDEIYKDMFSGHNSDIAFMDKTDRNKIYIQFNKRNNFCKIGLSKSPKNREKTLQSQEPEIEMIACWIAPKIIEKELHRLFESKKVRGEWFNLTAHDLVEIDKYMTPYKL